jgi:hypothetical protein
MKNLKNVHEHLSNKSVVSKKLIKIVPLALLLLLVTSCLSVRVAADYDKEASFNNYKTYAFFKPGIDKAEISDLDKRRILRAVEAELTAKGFVKSENPDLLVSIFTKSREKINVNRTGFGPYGYGWGWSPWYWNNYSTVTSSTEGTLYVDLIDANKKELVWQGMGTGYLSKSMKHKEERIKEFVNKIMEKYPPGVGK